jgi:hypothetical protein
MRGYATVSSLGTATTVTGANYVSIGVKILGSDALMMQGAG